MRWRVGIINDNNGTLTIEWYNTTKQQWIIALNQQNMNNVLINNLASGQFGILHGMSSSATTALQQNLLYTVAFKNIKFVSQD